MEKTEVVVPTLLLTVEEAAQALRLGRTNVHGMVMRGLIGSVKIGAARRIPVSALQSYIDRLMEEQQQEKGDLN